MDSLSCPALGIDYATLLIGLAAGIALGIAGVCVWSKAADQDDFPDPYDPHARPFADSEGGRNV